MSVAPLARTPTNEKEVPIDEKKDDTHIVREEVGQEITSDLVILSQDVDVVYDRAIALSVEEVTEILESAWHEHSDDPNFPNQVKAKIEYFLSGDASTLENYDQLLEEMKIEAGLIRFSSPYPEVRSVVAASDDPTLPVLTFRVLLLGTIWCGIGSFINQFFSIRTPTFTLSVNEVQLLSYPMARFLAWVLPTRKFQTWRWQWSLNPGPFNEKEHMLLTIMANVGMTSPYTVNVLITQVLPMYYNQEWAANFGYQITTSLSVALIGQGFAGMTRRFLVYPEHCIWLLNLSTIALNKSFHDRTNVVADGWKISRMKFFLIAFSAMFVYYWLPGSLFQALCYFNWITWIKPESAVIGNLFGQVQGLGLNPIFPSLDWSWYTGSNAMILPFFSIFQQWAGAWCAVPIILGVYYTNVWGTGHLPLVTNRIYDNQGKLYNVSKILDSRKWLDQAKYEAYSKPYMASSNVVLYAFFFALYAATISHTFLYHRKEISNGFRAAYVSIRSGQKGNAAFKDYHNQAMLAYPEVPELWYLGLTVIAIALGCVGLTAYPTESSVSAIFFGIMLCIVLVIPIGIILSITGVQVTLNVFAEFIGGLIYPGNALSMNYFKSFGVVTCMNALQFASDLKLAHYMKVPQRMAFGIQIYGTLIATFVSVSILNYQMTKIPDVCTVNQKDHFTCSSEATFFTATVFWGTLGPKRVFGAGGIYTQTLWAYLIGFFLPFPFYFAARRWPRTFAAKIHVPVLLYGALTFNPYANISNLWGQVVIGYIFQVYIRRKYLAWWSKYNYVLATALASAIPICAILIFAIISTNNLTPVWAGNDLPFAGCDAEGCRYLPIPESGYIGDELPNTGAWK